MADGPTWTFRQLAGAKKTFTLAGWSAPHGRPRQGPVVRTPLKVRVERVRYPGGEAVTRHEFGTQLDDWELKGRFRDRTMGGTGQARAKVQELLAFVRDAQQVQIAWGQFIAFTGFIFEFDPGYESGGEVEWTLRVQIDKDDTLARPAPRAVPTSPPLTAAEIYGAMLETSLAISAPALPGDFFAALSELLDILAGAVGLVLAVAETVVSYEAASFQVLGSLVSAVAAVRVAAIAVRETFAAFPWDGTYANRADDTIRLLRAQARAEAQILAMLGGCAHIERGAERTRAARIRTTVTATDGDTWEGLSTRFYGSPDRAGDLREANRIPAGQNPVGGVEYLVPK